MDAFTADDWEHARRLLCRLGNDIRAAVLAARETGEMRDWANVAEVTTADTIYRVDKISEGTVLGWLGANWPADWPLELVMEGVTENRPVTFPTGTPTGKTTLKLIVDPIDGTRPLMYDKRAAWVLAGLAPQRGTSTNLADIRVAAMTELPTTKQWRADQLSAVRGAGVVMEGIDAFQPTRKWAITPRPSRATDFEHGFATFFKPFPEGKALTAQIEEALWDRLHGPGHRPPTLAVFDDQYLSTGGQLYELMTGRDRMVADLRPLVLSSLGYHRSMTCHPYDICTGFLLAEVGGVIETPDGRPLNAPLDTTSPVAWIGYANETLARLVRPVLRQLCEHYLASTRRNAC